MSPSAVRSTGIFFSFRNALKHSVKVERKLVQSFFLFRFCYKKESHHIDNYRLSILIIEIFVLILPLNYMAE